MSNIPKEYPEVIAAEDKMNKLLSELAGLQSSYSADISNVLTEIPKNKYHGTILELCSDKGVLRKLKWWEMLESGFKDLGRGFEDIGKEIGSDIGTLGKDVGHLLGVAGGKSGAAAHSGPLNRAPRPDVPPGYELMSCGSKRGDCGAPTVTFNEYAGQLVEQGKSVGSAIDLMQAYNACGADGSCAGFTGMGESGPYKLVTSAASFTKEASTPQSRAFVKDADITVPASSTIMSSKSLGVPTRVQYRKLSGVRGLTPGENAAYIDVGGGKAGAALMQVHPLQNPILESPQVPFPQVLVEKALSVANLARIPSVVIGKTADGATGAAVTPIMALLAEPGWDTYVPENEFAAMAKIGDIPSGEIVDSWIPGANSEKMKERCPVTCDVECGDFYFVTVDNTVRPIAKSLAKSGKVCGKPYTRIRKDMYQFLNEQGFRLDTSRPITKASDCEINLLGSDQKAKIQNVMNELMALGEQVRGRVTTLRSEGDRIAKETGVANNKYNQVAKAYQGLEGKMGSVLQIGGTMQQMTADFKSRAISQEDYQSLWMVLSVVVIALMVYMARK